VALLDFIDFTRLLQLVKGFLGPFGLLIDKAKDFVTRLINIVSDANKLIESVTDEVDGWRNFKQDIRIAQRVIQIERAITKTRELIEGIPAAWKSILDAIKQIRTKLTSSSTAFEDASSAAEDLEAGGIKDFLSKFPRLARALTRVLGILTIAIEALESISRVIGDLQTVVDELKRLRLEVERLDTIFLSQSNKRRTLKLAGGGTVRIRVGHLHQ
jgi:methyl-accepting chemotaxis protein